MKKQIYTSLLVVASALAFNSSAFADEDCATGVSGLDKAPALQKLLNNWGGVEKLNGYWKLTGLAGTFHPMTIKIMIASDQFSDQVAENGGLDNPDTHLKLCVDTDDDQTLQVEAPHPSVPANAVIEISNFQEAQGFTLANGQHSGLGFKPTTGFPSSN